MHRFLFLYNLIPLRIPLIFDSLAAFRSASSSHSFTLIPRLTPMQFYLLSSAYISPCFPLSRTPTYYPRLILGSISHNRTTYKT